MAIGGAAAFGTALAGIAAVGTPNPAAAGGVNGADGVEGIACTSVPEGCAGTAEGCGPAGDWAGAIAAKAGFVCGGGAGFAASSAGTAWTSGGALARGQIIPCAVTEADNDQRRQQQTAARHATLGERHWERQFRFRVERGLLGLEATDDILAVEAEVIGVSAQEAHRVGRTG